MTVPPDAQKHILDALRSPQAWPNNPARVEVIETHGAVVFLAGDDVVKVKRAVKLAYLDFSTLRARERLCRRELELNRANAPELYLDVVAIRRGARGDVTIGEGEGEVVDWGVRMRRFSQDDLMSNIAARGALTVDLLKLLADQIVAAHARAPKAAPDKETIADTAKGITRGLLKTCGAELRSRAEALGERIEAAVHATASIRSERAQLGYVRRCHGDLHLNNIVLWQGKPLPFDALEFDEGLATIDTLYDLAFLIMDLLRKSDPGHANVLLNRYLWRTGDPLDLKALAALPLFLGLRAGIRAVVALDKATIAAGGGGDAVMAHVAETLNLAISFLRPPSPSLIGVGGLSGTGKSVLSAALAPMIGGAPGALHLRTDLERKWIAGVEETERLPPAAYSPETAEATYARVLDRARLALEAGHSVIVDGVCASERERSSLADLARETGAAFQGFWLAAAPETLRRRVEGRVGDASDATVDVLERQLATIPKASEWAQIDAEGPPEIVAERARQMLGRKEATPS